MAEGKTDETYNNIDYDSRKVVWGSSQNGPEMGLVVTTPYTLPYLDMELRNASHLNIGSGFVKCADGVSTGSSSTFTSGSGDLSVTKGPFCWAKIKYDGLLALNGSNEGQLEIDIFGALGISSTSKILSVGGGFVVSGGGVEKFYSFDSLYISSPIFIEDDSGRVCLIEDGIFKSGINSSFSLGYNLIAGASPGSAYFQLFVHYDPS